MRVARIQKESDSVTSFVLTPIDGKHLLSFRQVNLLFCDCVVDSGQAAGSSQLFAV